MSQLHHHTAEISMSANKQSESKVFAACSIIVLLLWIFVMSTPFWVKPVPRVVDRVDVRVPIVTSNSPRPSAHVERSAV